MTSTPISLIRPDPKTANLAVLQRIDADVYEVLSTAGYVAIYLFLEDTQSWERKDIEGAFFIVKR